MKDNKGRNNSFLDEVKKNGITISEDIYNENDGWSSNNGKTGKGLTLPPEEDDDAEKDE